MPRKPRIELPGGLDHVTSRGNNRQKIVRSADDYPTFTEIVGVPEIETAIPSVRVLPEDRGVA
jgi:hypothetical protein